MPNRSRKRSRDPNMQAMQVFCSKKIENHVAAVAIHFMHYNFARPHKTLASPYPRTPAMAAGISDHVWTAAEIVELSA